MIELWGFKWTIIEECPDGSKVLEREIDKTPFGKMVRQVVIPYEYFQFNEE